MADPKAKAKPQEKQKKAKVDRKTGELTDKELEQVSGGVWQRLQDMILKK